MKLGNLRNYNLFELQDDTGGMVGLFWNWYDICRFLSSMPIIWHPEISQIPSLQESSSSVVSLTHILTWVWHCMINTIPCEINLILFANQLVDCTKAPWKDRWEKCCFLCNRLWYILWEDKREREAITPTHAQVSYIRRIQMRWIGAVGYQGFGTYIEDN